MQHIFAVYHFACGLMLETLVIVRLVLKGRVHSEMNSFEKLDHWFLSLLLTHCLLNLNPDWMKNCPPQHIILWLMYNRQIYTDIYSILVFSNMEYRTCGDGNHRLYSNYHPYIIQYTYTCRCFKLQRKLIQEVMVKWR